MIAEKIVERQARCGAEQDVISAVRLRRSETAGKVPNGDLFVNGIRFHVLVVEQCRARTESESAQSCAVSFARQRRRGLDSAQVPDQRSEMAAMKPKSERAFNDANVTAGTESM